MKFMPSLLIASCAQASLLRGSAHTTAYPHAMVHDALIGAFNQPTLLPSLVDWFADADDVQLCDPFPFCKTGKEAIKKHLVSLNDSLLDSYMIGVPLGSNQTMPFQGPVGGLWVPSLQMSLRSESSPDSCLVGSEEYLQWNFVPGTKKLASLNIYYDEATRRNQLSQCAGSCTPNNNEPRHNQFTTKHISSKPPSCSASVSRIMMGDGAEVPDARKNLQSIFDRLMKFQTKAQLTTVGGSEEWVDGWVKLFSEDPNVAQCDPAPFCVYGKANIRKRFEGFAKTVAKSNQQFVGNNLMVSKNYGFQMTTFSSLEKGTGCIQNHIQFTVFKLDENQPSSIDRFYAYYSIAVHDFHKCRAPALTVV